MLRNRWQDLVKNILVNLFYFGHIWPGILASQKFYHSAPQRPYIATSASAFLKEKLRCHPLDTSIYFIGHYIRNTDTRVLREAVAHGLSEVTEFNFTAIEKNVGCLHVAMNYIIFMGVRQSIAKLLSKSFDHHLLELPKFSVQAL